MIPAALPTPKAKPVRMLWTRRTSSSALPKGLAPALGLLLALSACTSSSSTEQTTNSAGHGSTIVVTTDIWTSVVEQVVCEGDADIVTLLPQGSDPHAFEPSLRDRTVMGEATLVIANGLHLEAGLSTVFESVEADGGSVLLLGESLGLDDADPHFWFDPSLVAQASQAIADELIATTLLHAETLQDCTDTFVASMTELDAQIEGTLSAIAEPSRKLVTNHDSLGYLAERYDLQVVGTVLPSNSSLAETNPAELERLKDLIADAGVPAIFSETQHSSRDAAALADQLAIVIIELETSSLGDSQTYQTWLLHTVGQIATALSN